MTERDLGQEIARLELEVQQLRAQVAKQDEQIQRLVSSKDAARVQRRPMDTPGSYYRRALAERALPD